MSSVLETFKICAKIPQNIKTKIKLFHVFNVAKDWKNFNKNIIFVTKEDKVYGLGNNMFGTLGLGHNTEVNECIEIKELSNQKINSIVSGWDFVLAGNEENLLFGWGVNQFGQLGRCETTSGYHYLKPGQIEFFKDKNIADICCGAQHTLVLSSNGDLYGWGYNILGQLGLHKENNLNKPTKLVIQEGKEFTFKYIYCVYLQSFAITTEGLLFSWGYNSHGALGQHVNSKCVPKQINLTNIIEMSGTQYNTYFLTDDGHIYFCGSVDSENPFLGTFVSSPTKIELFDISIKDLLRIYGSNSKALCRDLENRFYNLEFGKIMMVNTKVDSTIEFCANHFEITQHMVRITNDGKVETSKKINLSKNDRGMTENNETNNFMASIRFNLLCELGQGNFGNVQKFQNVFDHKFYAIKKIDISNYPYKLDEELMKEVRIMTSIRSSFVVCYHNSWIESNFLFIQMEYCFDNLKNVLKTKPQVFERTENQAMNSIEYFISCEIFRQITEALNYLHSIKPEPLIHKNLKPENIQIAKTKKKIKCKLSDFGLTQIVEAKFSQHTAPEVITKKVYQTKSDIYSLGMIGLELFELIEESASSRFENCGFKEKFKKLEMTLTIHMTAPVAYRRPSCDSLFGAMKDWSIDCREVRSDPHFTHYLEKFKTNDLIYFYDILNGIQSTASKELTESKVSK